MELVELAHLVDSFERKREDRLAADKLAAALKKEETAFSKQIVAVMLQDGVGMVGGNRKRVTLQTNLVPTATDWDAIRQYILESGNWQLMQKRLTAASYLDLAAEGEVVPGVESYEVHKLSVANL